MKGKYRVVVQNRSLHYEFEIGRNITIIQGDSATGKTTLINLIRTHYNLGDASGISLSCEKTCKVLEGKDWKNDLEKAHDVIFFTDEENDFIHTEEFASAIRYTDNYYVFITRENLYQLPYSVDEIYGIRSSGKYQNTKRVYQETYKIYSNTDKVPIRPDLVITEDSNAGFEFFENVCAENGIKCRSAGGNSKIAGMLDDIGDSNVCVIADGAAFGSYMNKLSGIIKDAPNVFLYLPESFEYIVLDSGLIDGNRIRRILDDPSEFIDSSEFFSWENYFTSLIVAETADTHMKYRKEKLNGFYLHKVNKEKILGVVKGIRF